MSEVHISYFFGNDEYAIRKAAEKASASLFKDPTAAGMNSSRFDARAVSEKELINTVGAMPFLAAQRLVVLENVSKKYTGLDGHKKFVAFLETVPSATRLILIDILDEIREKEIASQWMIKWTEKNAARAEHQVLLMPRQKEMPGWIVAETRKQKGAITQEAAARLAEMCGADTRQAAQEINKLLTYVNFAHTIDIEDVEAVCILTASVDIFELVDALGTQNGKLAQRLFHRLLEEKDAFEIFGMVVRQFRLLILALEVIDEHGSQQDVVEALGVHSYVAQKCYMQAKAFNMTSLEAIYRRLLAIDEAAKTGKMPLDASLDIFIMELTGSAR